MRTLCGCQWHEYEHRGGTGIAPTSRALNRAFALDMAPLAVIFLSEDDVEGASPAGAFADNGGLFVSCWASSWAKRSSRTASSWGTGVTLAAGDALGFFNLPMAKNGGLGGERCGLSNADGRRSRLVIRATRPNTEESASLGPGGLGRGLALLMDVRCVGRCGAPLRSRRLD